MTMSTAPSPSFSPDTGHVANVYVGELLAGSVWATAPSWPDFRVSAIPLGNLYHGEEGMSRINRRAFLDRVAGGTVLATTAPALSTGEMPTPAGADMTTRSGETTMPISAFADIPNFCAHEHWGSIPSIGQVDEGFRADVEAGAAPARRTGVWDIVLDPYFGGWLGSARCDWDAMARLAGAADFRQWWEQSPEAALCAMQPHLEHQTLTGAFQCIRRGILLLHGADIGKFGVDAWKRVDESITAKYGDMFGWYHDAMNQARFSGLIRPVHPEFYRREFNAGTAATEREFTRTILRIDPFLDFWREEHPRRDALADLAGVDPADGASWREFLTRVLDWGVVAGNTGIKQLQAYSRPLDFAVRAQSEVKWRGALTPEEIRAFQDWVVHECCKQAHERGWPHQIHVGTHNLEESGPLPLEALARRYPKMNLVLLHCWPFLEESGWLAKHLPNVFLDTCWQVILNPHFYRDALDQWLKYVPAHKIMSSHDATSVEMAAGSSLFIRETLEASLETVGMASSAAHRRQVAAGILNGNAAQLYGVAS